MDPFESLPDELILVQALSLPLESIDEFCQINSRFNALVCNNEFFWEQRFLQDYEVVPEGYEGTWKELYRQYSSVFPRRGRPYSRGRPYNPKIPTILGPALYNDELVQFFAQASLGPAVDGEYQLEPGPIEDAVKISGVDSLRPTRIPLNATLFFTRPTIFGQKNPLYGMIAYRTLFLLLNLHTNYSKVTGEMKELLPSLSLTTSPLTEDRVILLQSTKIRDLSQAELEALVPEVTRIYGPFFPDHEVIIPEMVFQYQQAQASLANAYMRNRNRIMQRHLMKVTKEIMERIDQEGRPLAMMALPILQNPNLTIEQQISSIERLLD